MCTACVLLQGKAKQQQQQQLGSEEASPPLEDSATGYGATMYTGGYDPSQGQVGHYLKRRLGCHLVHLLVLRLGEMLAPPSKKQIQVKTAWLLYLLG